MGKLERGDREFLVRLTDLVYSNPFSDDPQGMAPATPVTIREDGSERLNHYLDSVVPELRSRLDAIRAGGVTRVDQLDGDERRLLEHSVLFDHYDRYVDHLDRHIEEQQRQGAEPAPVPFARAAIQELEAWGFTEPVALKFFALFFQMRRAFFFIARGLVGVSPCMKILRRALWDSTFSRDVRVYERHLWARMEDFSTLLLGETGAGKGAAAAALGRSSFIPFDPERGRFAESFAAIYVAINLSQYPESLIESELFGHRKGAFTGAIADHEGVFQRCSPHGTLFLDEIGDVGAPIQIKLLQVLQERTFRSVGSEAAHRFEGRVIGATNRPLDRLRREGAFRDDFFYRLCSNVITVPTLRQRIEESRGELETLVALALERITGAGDSGLADQVLDVLSRDLPRDYPWPGNVRELEQAVRRVLLVGHYTGEQHSRPGDPAAALNDDLEHGRLSASELLSRYARQLYRGLGTYEEVARRLDVDRRTAKKYIDG